MSFFYFYLVFMLFFLLLLPGLALLTIGNVWRQWSKIQCVFIAFGLSIACYPIVFYGISFWRPTFSITSELLLLCLIGCGAIAIYPMIKKLVLAQVGITGLFRSDCEQYLEPKHNRQDKPLFIAATATIFLLILGSRLWILHDNPYPAWTDSLHHTLLTQLVAERGQLAWSLEPYFAIPLDMYHLGLYSITGSAQMLSGASAHATLMWTMQILNGLSGIGVYLALDRFLPKQHAHRWLSALCGAAVVGLFSHHPALYASWGRYTQLASQVIFLIAWVMVVDTTMLWSQWWQERHPRTESPHTMHAPRSNRPLFWQSIFSGLLTAAVFLLHFRVAAFYIALLFVSLSAKIWRDWKEERLTGTLLGIAAIGGISLFFVFPALVPALQTFVELSTQPLDKLSAEQVETSIDASYAFPLSSVPYLVARPWLLFLSGAAALIGLWRRNYIVQISLVWVVLLLLIGNAYLLGISWLNITNLGAILIMLYLPIGLTIGAGLGEVLTVLPLPKQRVVGALAAVVLLIGGIYGAMSRATEREDYRFFLTNQDVAAMDWIRENTAPTARFAVNTYAFLPIVSHGADAGYWIPYFAKRATTSPAMPILAAEWDYQLELLDASKAVEALVNSVSIDDMNTALISLQDHNVSYIYIGASGHFEGGGLQLDELLINKALTLLYENQGAAVIKIGEITR